VDGYAPAVEEARRNATHDEILEAKVSSLADVLADRKFDACVALDLIEHLPKDQGYILLNTLEKIAQTRVVISTPNGFLPQKSKDGDLQEHLSGWTASDFRQRGYRVFGMYGPKALRGEYHLIRRHPRPFWLAVSISAHYLYTRARPESSAAVFCIKEL
jgi:2-polyprenyl-3-methyl-5-hydroxy-6-metoxy-1,4-benzoquinol methylase